jgi:hypothetical protein
MFRTEALSVFRFFVLMAVAFVVVPRASAGIVGVANATGPCSADGLTSGGGRSAAGTAHPIA